MVRKNINTDWEIFYSQDMKQMGGLFEIAYNRGYNMNVFIPTFMNSKTRELMDNWHPALSNGPIHYIISWFIDEVGDIEKSDLCYPENCMRWVGMMYAYLIYYTSMSSKELINEIPLDDMLHYYITGHQMEFKTYADKLFGDK